MLTAVNFQLYTLELQGSSPVSVDDMKNYLGIPLANNINDSLIQQLIDSCTAWGESYTHREFRANLWSLQINCFESRIEVRRNPVDTIDSIEYSVATQFDTLIDPSTYYKINGRWYADILETPNNLWPSDGLDIEQGIKITFTTKAVGPNKLDQAISAIKRHVAYMFENRGDCGDCGSCSGKDSAGVTSLYDLLRIPRI